MGIELESITARNDGPESRYYDFKFTVTGTLDPVRLTVTVPEDGNLESSKTAALGRLASFAEGILHDLQGQRRR